MNEQNNKSEAADIATSKESVVDSDETALEEQKRFDHEHRTQRTRLGWLGFIFGEGNEKAGNVAGFIAIICLLALVGRFIFYAQDFDKAANGEGLNNLVYVLTLCLGYLFGRK